MIHMSELTKDFYKTGEIAKFLNVSTRTVQNYCMDGKLDEIFTATNRRLISKESFITYLTKHNLLVDDSSSTKYDAIYARVSTHKQKERGDLERQIDTISRFAIDKNPKKLKIFSDVASGLNDNRKQLNNLLDSVMNNEVDRIFIHYKDRLTRFGFNYLMKICSKYNTEIVIVSNDTNTKTLQEELAEDIISVIHSFSGKLYGMRSKVKEEVDKELS